jgi:putative membrane-bound dehydrogenase-like protein
MRNRSLVCALAATCWVGAIASAQIGDRADKPGVVQKPPSFSASLPPSPALSPAEALKTFKLAPGIKLELVAAEPLVEDPVAITFGFDGRLWVVEMRGYMPDIEGRGEDQPVGRIVVLSDSDGDGTYDKSTVFLDGLVLPRAIALVGDGVLVGAPPELAFWRDTNGDGKADSKFVLANDYGIKIDPARPLLANPENAPNGLLWASDNWIYSATYTKKFRYRNKEWETAPTSFRGQWGLSQDDFGRFFHNSNEDQLRADVIFAEYLRRNPNYPRLSGASVNTVTDQLVWPGRLTPGVNRGYRPDILREGKLRQFTAACAPWIYRGDLLPELYGNAFIAEPAANLVRRNIVTAEGGSITAHNAYNQDEFITSTDERFRPVNFTTGPDGALYIVDFYRGVLQHRMALTSYLRQQIEERGLVEPLHRGRIYRVLPAGQPTRPLLPSTPATTAQWVERLSHPNSWWRETAQRILVERNDPASFSLLRTVARSNADPRGRAQAFRVLDGLEVIDRESVLAGMGDSSPLVRAVAARISARFLSASGEAEFTQRLLELVDDTAPEVQLQATLTLGESHDLATKLTLARHVRDHPQNKFLVDAFLSGITGEEWPLIESLAADPNWPPDNVATTQMLASLASGVFTSRQPDDIGRLILLAAHFPRGDYRAGALLDGMASSIGTSRRSFALAAEPQGWTSLSLDSRNRSSWAKIDRVLTWPGKPGAAVTAPKPLTPPQQERFEAGRTIFSSVCAACHGTNGQGVDGLAPPFLDSEWILGPPSRSIRIVLHGLRGPIRVLGQMHTGDMPALGGAFDDRQIASVLTYLRRAWGHTGDPVEPDQVRAIRADTPNHADAWSQTELMEIK